MELEVGGNISYVVMWCTSDGNQKLSASVIKSHFFPTAIKTFLMSLFRVGPLFYGTIFQFSQSTLKSDNGNSSVGEPVTEDSTIVLKL